MGIFFARNPMFDHARPMDLISLPDAAGKDG